MDPILQKIIQEVVNGEKAALLETIKIALDNQVEAETILNEGLIPAMREVGRRFEIGEFFLPEMLIAARAMQSGLALIKPRLNRANVKLSGKVIIGTVKGDLHDIGKNLVAMMLEGAGFEIIDLGTDVSSEKIIEAVQAYKPDIVALSALLTTTMINMGAVIEALKAAGLRETVKVIIGGAPVKEDFAQQIGADGYAPDASRAVSLAESLLQG